MVGLDLESLSSTLGVSTSILRFLSCLFFSLPVSYFHRVFKSVWTRHLYSFSSGLILCCGAYGVHSGALLLAPVLLSYFVMCLTRKNCGYIVFASSFAYLVHCHAKLLSGSEWRNGNVDYSGTLMILTLKVTSVAMDYQDGESNSSGAKPQHPHRLLKIPSVLEFLGFIFCNGSILVGPLYHFHVYSDFSEKKGIWSEANPQPSFWLPALQSFSRSFICVLVHKFLISVFSTTFLLSPQFLELNFIQRLCYICMVAFSVRWMYYFIWSVSETSLILSGLGFSGYSNETHPRPQWKHAKNVDIKGVELSTSATLLPAYWNIGVGNWLRYYVYNRLIPLSGKANIFTLIFTQVVSALWHGLYPGYYLFFVNSAFAQHTSKCIYKFQKSIPEKWVLTHHFLNVLHFIFTQFTLGYSQVGFIILAAQDTITIWKSLYYFGTFLPLFITFVLPLAASKEKIK